MGLLRSFGVVLSSVVQALAVNVICICLLAFGSGGKQFAWRLAQTNWISGLQAFLPAARIYRSGEMLKHNGPCILVANHQVDVDWWYIWLLALSEGEAHNIKIILKDTLARLPIFGWAMYFLGFIFLKRNWAEDKIQMHKKLNVFVEENFPIMLLIFPEGTTVNTASIMKSKEFAKKTDRPSLDLLMIPRVTGFETCLRYLGPECTVYDLTMAFEGYSGEIPTYEMGYEREVDKSIPNFSKLVTGHDSAVHIHVSKFKASEIENVEKWLDERWVRKEKLLKQFIQNKKFPEEELGPSQLVKVKGSWSSVVFLWSVVIVAAVFLPLALMLLIPYSIVFMFSYAYIMYTEYSHSLLSREERSHIVRRTVVQRGFVVGSIIFAVAIVLAWIFSFYSFVTKFMTN